MAPDVEVVLKHTGWANKEEEWAALATLSVDQQQQCVTEYVEGRIAHASEYVPRRNPMVDPQPGDVLLSATDNRSFVVDGLEDYDVLFRVFDGKRFLYSSRISLPSWRESTCHDCTLPKGQP